MTFFDSEIVRSSITEIAIIQEDLQSMFFKIPYMDNDEKIKYIQLMETLLEKQKILYTRLSLSEDPSALKIKNRIKQSMIDLGIPDDMDISIIFNGMQNIIDRLKINLGISPGGG
jgi:hypothetical protein